MLYITFYGECINHPKGFGGMVFHRIEAFPDRYVGNYDPMPGDSWIETCGPYKDFDHAIAIRTTLERLHHQDNYRAELKIILDSSLTTPRTHETH